MSNVQGHGKGVEMKAMKLIGVCAALAMAGGCCWTGGAYTSKDGTEVKCHTARFLYPFEVGGAELVAPAAAGTTAGKLSISGYKTEGGASGVVAIMDKAGNIIGTVAKGAVAAP